MDIAHLDPVLGKADGGLFIRLSLQLGRAVVVDPYGRVQLFHLDRDRQRASAVGDVVNKVHGIFAILQAPKADGVLVQLGLDLGPADQDHVPEHAPVVAVEMHQPRLAPVVPDHVALRTAT